MFNCRVIESNSTGSRIVKTVETGPKGFEAVNYVVQVPSRLAMKPQRVNGKFAKGRPTPVACTLDVRTGWMVGPTFTQLAAARAALGIDTSPKSLAA